MKKLWLSFAVVFSLSFAVLGWIGTRIYQQMPPIPRTVLSTDGTVLLADGVSRNLGRLQAEDYLDVDGRNIIVKGLTGLKREQESPQ